MTSASGTERGATARGGWETTEAWAAGGEAERIAEFGEALAQESEETRERLRALDRNLAHALRVLALTPGREFVEQLLRLYRRTRGVGTGPETSPRFLASLIAQAQSLDDALHVLSDDGTDRADELRVCLFHELLLRGENPRELRRRADTAYLVPPWHVLAWLPDELAEMEYGAEFPSRSYRGSVGTGFSGLSSPVWVDAAARRAGAAYRVREATPAHLVEAIGGPPSVGGWAGYEAGVFTTERAVAPEALPGVLTTLPMDCLEGLKEHQRFDWAPCPLDEVWELLYATASGGGLYHPGVHGAYGRLSAWRSVAGLCGAGRGAGAAEVERRAQACTWVRFEADTEWFHNEIYDYGIAALTPDGRRIAVLAATDTD